MKYVNLGTTGLKVSELCLGTMTFGREADRKASEAIYRRCREAGINFFDCANVYSSGEAERILGEIIPEERDRLIVTTKVGGAMGEGPNQEGLSRRHLIQQCEQSLRRLNTGWIDVYFAHRFDTLVPVEETLRAFDTLIQQGKVRYLGVSNWAAWQIAKALGTSALYGLSAIRVMQPMYNLVKRQAEVELLPLALDAGMGVIAYNPLGRGLADRQIRPHANGRRGPAFRDRDVHPALRSRLDARGGSKAESRRGRGRDVTGEPGHRLGGAPPGGELPHHRRPQCCADRAGTDRPRNPDDRRALRAPVGPDAGAAAGDRSHGRPKIGVWG